MNDETPQSEGEASPLSDDSPTAETTPVTNDDAAESASNEDAAASAPATTPTPPPAPEPDGTPTEANPVPAAAAATADPAAPPTPPASSPERPAGIFIPKWLGITAAAIVAAVVFGSIGYAIGDSSDSGSTSNAVNTLPSVNDGNDTRQLPNGFPFPGNGNGNGNGTTAGNAGFLGVGVVATDDDKGVDITEVAEGSPAAEAGLQEGDVITAVDGDSVDSPFALRAAVSDKQAGDEISVTYTRDGASNTVDVTLTSRSRAQSS